MCRIRRFAPGRARWPIWDRRSRRSRCCGWRALPRRPRIAQAHWPSFLRRSESAQIMEDAASAAIWSSVRDVLPFAAGGALGAWPVWRIVCPPASGGALGERLARDTGGDVIYDWGGGLIWAALPPKPDAPGRAGARARRCRRRPRHADPRLRADTAQCRCVSSASQRPCELERTRPPQLRSEKHPQSRPDDAGSAT